MDREDYSDLLDDYREVKKAIKFSNNLKNEFNKISKGEC